MTTTKRNKKEWRPFSYEDYNDHFETPSIAYRDIAPLLDWLTEKSRDSHVVYDPYYCNGRTKTLFKELGFAKIIHEKRDFYKDIDENKVPSFQTLVTNPPYSDRHKERCLEFAFSQLREHNKPFFLLMPNYVASREYYRRISGDLGVVYLSPCEPYNYSHPEGTGKEIPPFASLWFVGIGEDRIKKLKSEWYELNWDEDRRQPKLALSIEELKQNAMIPSQKRPNPRQRCAKKKRQKQSNEILLNHDRPSITSRQNTEKLSDRQAQQESVKTSKKSKYRNSTGQRQKKRF